MLNNAEAGADMETATHQGTEGREGPPNAARLAALEKRGAFVSLEHETRAAVDTETAAFHLSREPQTLRVWACKENGPLRPLRVNGRLAWPTDAIRRLLGVTV